MKIKVLKWLMLAYALQLTSSCAIYEGGKTTINYTNTNTQNTTILEDKDDKTEPVVQSESASTPSINLDKKDVRIKLIKVGCSKFIPPARQPEPTISDEDLSNIRKDSEKTVIGILLTHIRKVHNYNTEYDRSLEEALAKHYRTCNRN